MHIQLLLYQINLLDKIKGDRSDRSVTRRYNGKRLFHMKNGYTELVNWLFTAWPKVEYSLATC